MQSITHINPFKMIYINYKFNGENETIEECETKNEANFLLREYEISDPYGEYWISSRRCKK
jgi:hypothetical protein